MKKKKIKNKIVSPKAKVKIAEPFDANELIEAYADTWKALAEYDNRKEEITSTKTA